MNPFQPNIAKNFQKKFILILRAAEQFAFRKTNYLCILIPNLNNILL